MKGCKVCPLFCCAFLGAMMMYALRIAVRYRTNPKLFQFPSCWDILAQGVIALIVTALTFLSLWREITADNHQQEWQLYVRAFTQTAIQELIFDAIQRP